MYSFPYTTPQRKHSRILSDDYNDIALESSLTPNLKRIESDNLAVIEHEEPEQLHSELSRESTNSSLSYNSKFNDRFQAPKIKKDFGTNCQFYNFENIPLLEEEFIQKHMNDLDLIRQNLNEYQETQKSISNDLKRLMSLYLTETLATEISSTTPTTTTRKEYDISNRSTSSFDSIQSDIDIELNYQLTSFIKSNNTNRDLVRKVSKVRNVVNLGLNFINDEFVKDQDLHGLNHKFVDELNELVEAFTE